MKKNFLQSASSVIFLTIVFHLPGCTLSQQSNEMKYNRRLWRKNNIVNYRFIGSSKCGAVIIKVRDGKATSIEQAFKSRVGTNLDCYEKFDTVDKIFGYVQQQMENGKPLYVKYNEKFGFPEEIKIGSSFDTENQISIKFTGFEAIE